MFIKSGYGAVFSAFVPAVLGSPTPTGTAGTPAAPSSKAVVYTETTSRFKYTGFVEYAGCSKAVRQSCESCLNITNWQAMHAGCRNVRLAVNPMRICF